MKKFLRILIISIAALSFSGCIYTGIVHPVPMEIDNEVAATKSGTACSTMILGLIFTGDAGVDAAKKNGGITKVHNVDMEMTHILGYLYGKHCFIVHGE